MEGGLNGWSSFLIRRSAQKAALLQISNFTTGECCESPPELRPNVIPALSWNPRIASNVEAIVDSTSRLE